MTAGDRFMQFVIKTHLAAFGYRAIDWKQVYRTVSYCNERPPVIGIMKIYEVD